MSYKNVNFNKRVIRKRMLAVIIYGIIFLISTIAYYFVNTSNAQKVLKVGVSVIDKDMNLEITNFELKAPEKDNKFSIELAPIQQGLWVNNYKIITKEEFQELKKNYEEKLENKEKNDKNETKQKEQIEKQTEEEKKKEEKEEKEEKVKKENEKKNQKTKKIQLTEEQIEEEKVYIIAEYDYKEYKNELIYNKNISNSQTTDKINISVSGYMPEQAELEISKVDIEETEKKIKESLKDENKDIKLLNAYDIKIVEDEKVFEPEDFDENAIVSIKGVKGEKYNIWHIKNDNTVELIKPEDQEDITFKTDSFSIYGIEEVVEETKNEETDNTIKADNTINNIETKENSIVEDTKIESNELQAGTKGPLRAAARNLPDSTLEINDYDSDYYYYLGQNYTETTSGTVINKYSASNLVRVTLFYHGFAQGETDNEKKGRISLDSGEEQDIVKNIKCVPVQNGNITLELMENPFMDKPTGYGFGGWNTSAGSVNRDSQTLTYNLSVETTSDITINLYAKWEQATVVYVNSDDGNDNLYDGLTEDTPFGSWGKAFEYINSHNTNEREKNIIVVTGNMDSSINYTRPVTGVERNIADVTYSSSTSFTSGGTYILSTSTGNNGNAIARNGTGITNESLSNTVEPSANAQWVITQSGDGYTIRNVDNNYYLAYNNGLRVQANSFTWKFNNRRFNCTVSNGWWDTTYYLRYNSGNWTTSTNQNQGTQLYFLTYTATNQQHQVINTKGNMGTNNSYRSANDSVPVTITSLYNHTDYRNNATISLTNTSYDDFQIYKAFQMNHVNIYASGYTSNADGDTFSSNYPTFTGRNNNVRIGRGIQCANTGTNGCTFANLMGGNVTDNNSSSRYKIIVESGKYSSILGFNSSSYSYSGIVYLVLGNDVDRAKGNNQNMSVYFELTVSRGNGSSGNSNNDKAFLIDVKSGSYGIDFFTEKGKNTAYSAYSGIYLGGYSGNSANDSSDRYCVVEGGLIANVIGGLKVQSGSSVKTRIYVKGGDIYNIVGGSGVSVAYADRIIQMTGGTVRYSISGGSNGVWAGSTSGTGQLQGNTLVYVGGNAQIGTQATYNDNLYEVDSGCVLGAGNGNYDRRNDGAGQVYSSRIIINDQAHILRNVYGGGNYGIVKAASGDTNGTTNIEILGGTIDGNVFGGANKNSIYGSTTINVKNGQVKGAVYGGSNTEGRIYTTSTINVTGGTLGSTSNTTNNEILFGGGFGESTIVSGNSVVNILDTDNNVNMYGSAYGGSSQGTMSQNVMVNIQDLASNPNTISIIGNVFAGGKGTNTISAKINGNATINVDGSNLPSASVFGGNDVNGDTQGNITVNIGQNYESKLLNAYGGGNLDATGTEADTVKVYLLNYAEVTNAFNGGKSADLTTGGTSDTTRAIYLQGGKAENIFGGSDSNGTVTASHVYIESGNATNVYGGNNVNGQTTESFVYITGGTSTNVYGGGYQATTPTTHVNLTGGVITNGFGGGNAANVTNSNIILDGTLSASIYGGSNSSGTVTLSNVLITSGTATDVYGGNNEGGNTVNTNVTINSGVENVYGGGNQAITSGNTNVLVDSAVSKVYGGGNQAITAGNTYLRLTNATVTNDAYGGGNGTAAIVNGNSITIIEGTTAINGDLFGGGNAAANGTTQNNNSVVTTLISGGTIGGDVYGAANTSVVYGETRVKIGSNVVDNNTMIKNNIQIDGTVFGGGKSNTAGSETYDFTFESVTGDAKIDIDATGYDDGTYNFNIGRSIFGSGNAAKISGYGIVNIKNYGSDNNTKNNISIQRASRVTLDHCNISLVGTTDTTNEIATAVYTFNRIDDLILKNNTTLYLASGVNIVSKMQSLDASGNKETVTIDETGITNQNVNNKIFLSQGRNIVLKTEAGTDGDVNGMAYVGLYKGTTTKEFGIYGDNYTQGSNISTEVAETFNRNSYVQGKHYTSHNIYNDGFYTKYNIDGQVKIEYIIPTPDDATYYQWIIGEKSTDIYYEDIELIATKYATTGTYVLDLNGLSYPNMIINVLGIDVSSLKNTVTLNDPDIISNIAPTAEEADSRFGLTMTAGNTGWQTKGTTQFLNNQDVQAGFQGKSQYLSDNSTTTPSFSFYLAHSKNISSTEDLGTVTIKLEAIYEENNEIKMKNVFVVLKLTTNNALQGTDYYEGAITPGKQYRIFPSTTTTITQNSSFSAYYSLYLNNYSNTTYYDGFVGHYYHTFESSCVLPVNTKITMIDKSGSSIKYYYYIVNEQDVTNNKKIYRFTDFFAMDSEEEHYSADGSYYNSTTDLLYEEYIVQIDFEDSTFEGNLESKNFLVQLRDVYDNNIALTVNTALYPMLYSVYNDIDVNKRLTLRTDKNVIYMGSELKIDIETQYAFNKNSNSDIVYETTHIEDQLGVRITISSGSDILTAADLEGIYITYNGLNYFPRSDGSYRIKIADAVSNVLTDMILNTENGSLETGTYTIKAQSFGSVDGTYFSSEIASDTKDVQVVSTDYGFSVSLDDKSVLIDKETGKTKNDNNNLAFTLGYSGGFEHPKIVVSLYRRSYEDIYSYDYNLIDLRNYVTNTLISTIVQNEYLVTDLLYSTQNFTLTLKNTGLTTGTYKIVFTLYDGNNRICDMHKTIIIK